MTHISRRTICRAGTLCLALALSACMTKIPNVSAGNALPPVTHSTVAGQIQWIENGQPRTLGNGVFGPALEVKLLRKGDQWTGTGEVDDQGRFAWALKPGTYLVKTIDFVDPWSGPMHAGTTISFLVPDAGKTYYIGRLEMNFATKRDLIGNLHRIGFYYEISDQDASVHAAIAEKLGIPAARLQSQLMAAADKTDGRAHLKEEDGDRLRKTAESGEPWALAMLQNAAQNGSGVAQLELGLLYSQGNVLPQSDTSAAEWWRKAANPRAYMNYIVLFEGDRQMLHVDAAGLAQLRERADKGDAQAQYNLGLLHANGLNVAQDYALAETWFRKAAEQGHAKAQHRLGLLEYFGLKSDPTKWLRLAPSLALSYSTASPELIDFNQLNTPKDNEAAERWFRKAAEQGNAAAQNNLGLLYARGQGVPQRYAEAAGWYRKAADQGFDYAIGNWGLLFEQGLGVRKNRAVALALYSLSPALAPRAQKLKSALDEAELKAARDLQQALQKPGKLSDTIEQYLAGSLHDQK